MFNKKVVQIRRDISTHLIKENELNEDGKTTKLLAEHNNLNISKSIDIQIYNESQCQEN